MSAPIETTKINTASVNTEVPFHHETPADDTTQEHHATDSTGGVPNTAATTTENKPVAVKVTPIQRINTVYNKAKQTLNEVISDAQKNVNEKNATTTATETVGQSATTADTAPHVDKKVGTHNTWKDILNRAKGFKPTSTTHPTAQEQLTSENVGTSDAPVPPPKDNVKSTTTQHHSGSPVYDQMKRNATLLATFILQKKKEYTEKKSSDKNIHQQATTATPELHDETVAAAAAPTTATQPVNTNTPPKRSSSPLVRRITQLVNGATNNINKRRDTKKTEVPSATAPATDPASPVTSVEEAPVVTNNTISTA